MSNLDLVLSRDSYLLGIELRIFWSVTFLYVFASLLFLFHALAKSQFPARAARAVLALTAAFHIGLIALRAFEAGRAPFQTLYETLSWFACSAAVTYLFASNRWKNVHLPGLFVTIISAGACLYALLGRSPAIEPLNAPLKSYWFEWHVTLAFFSYAVFVVSASVEASYLIIKPLARKGMAAGLGLAEDSLERFHSSSFRLAAFGFPFLTFAIFSGAAWANSAWGRYWSWDPKETWSLITWTVFTLYLHARATRAFRGLPASIFNLVGFVCMMMTFLGVNWLAKLLGIPSLHVYAI